MIKRWWPVLTIALALILLFGGRWYVDSVNQSHPAPWPMAGGGAGGRHYTAATLPQKPAVLWSLPVPQAEYMAPLIGADGSIYLDTGTELLAVAPDGQRRWAWKTSMRIWGMALSRHGILYAMDPENLQALDENGRLQWRAKLPGPPASPMIVGQGGTIFYASGDQLHALADDGSHKWSSAVGTVVAGPVESSGGLILVATAQQLYAIRPGGSVEWSRSLGEPVPTRPLAAGPDGRIYLRTRTSLLVLNEKGEIKADEPVTQFPSNLAVGNEAIQEGLSRRDPVARTLWTAAPGKGYRSLSTLIDAAGNALIMENQGTLRVSGSAVAPVIRYRLRDKEGKEIWNLGQLRPMSEPAVDKNGNLYFIGQKDPNSPVSLIRVGETPSL